MTESIDAKTPVCYGEGQLDGEIMGLFGEFTPTGLGVRGPASDLVELEDAKKSIFLAIWFHEDFLEDDALHQGIDVVRDFMEMPMVSGIPELKVWNADEALFVYPTGPVWTMAELLIILEDLDDLMPVKAALEMCAKVGAVLVDAAETGEAQGVHSHGGLTPSRICVDTNGNIFVIGYGIPQVEILAYLEDEEFMPTGASFRYCPPERLDGAAEDIGSDLFSLSVIAVECLTGELMYPGKGVEASELATEAKTMDRLDVVGEALSDAVFEALATALSPFPDERFDKPETFVSVMKALAEEESGESLADFMGRIAPEARVEDVDLPEDGAASATIDDAPKEKPSETPPSKEDAAPPEDDLAEAKEEVTLALKDSEQELKAAKAAHKAIKKPLKSSGLASIQELLNDADVFLEEVTNAVKDIKDILKEVSATEDPDAALDLAQEAGEIADNVAGISKDIEERVADAVALQQEADASAKDAKKAAAAQKAEEEAAAKRAEEEAAAKRAEEEAAAKRAEEEAAAKRAEEEAAAKRAEEEAAAQKAAEEAERLEAAKKSALSVLEGADTQMKAAQEQIKEWRGSMVELAETEDLIAEMDGQISAAASASDLTPFASAIDAAERADELDAVVSEIEGQALAVEGMVDEARTLTSRIDLIVKEVEAALAKEAAEVEARRQQIQGLADKAKEMTEVLSEYKKRGAKAKATVEKIDLEEASEVRQSVVSAIEEMVAFSKECSALAKGVGGVEAVEDAQEIVAQIEEKLGEVAENVSIAENGVAEVLEIEAQVLAAKQESERLAASLKMKRAEALGLYEAIATSAKASETTMTALDERVRDEDWATAWDEAHQFHAAIVDALDAALGVKEGIDGAALEEEADEGLSDLRRLEEQVETDESKVTASVSDIIRLHEEATAREEALQKELESIRSAAQICVDEWAVQETTWSEILTEGPDDFDATDWNERFSILDGERNTAVSAVNEQEDLDSVKADFASLQGALGQVRELVDALKVSIKEHVATKEAAALEAQRCTALRAECASIGTSLATSMEIAQSLIERLDSEVIVSGSEGAEEGLRTARATIEVLKSNIESGLEWVDGADSLQTSGELEQSSHNAKQCADEVVAQLASLETEIVAVETACADYLAEKARALATYITQAQETLREQMDGITTVIEDSGQRVAAVQKEVLAFKGIVDDTDCVTQLDALKLAAEGGRGLLAAAEHWETAEEVDATLEASGEIDASVQSLSAVLIEKVDEILAAVEAAKEQQRLTALAESKERAEALTKSLEVKISEAAAVRRTALDDAAAWSDDAAVVNVMETLDVVWLELAQKSDALTEHLSQVNHAETPGVADECLAAADRDMEGIAEAVAVVQQQCVALEHAAEAAETAAQEAARLRLEALASAMERAVAVHESCQRSFSALKSQCELATQALDRIGLSAEDVVSSVAERLEHGQEELDAADSCMKDLGTVDEPSAVEQGVETLKAALERLEGHHSDAQVQLEKVEVLVEETLERRRIEAEAARRVQLELLERVLSEAESLRDLLSRVDEAYIEGERAVQDTRWPKTEEEWKKVTRRKQALDAQSSAALGGLSDINEETVTEVLADSVSQARLACAEEAPKVLAEIEQVVTDNREADATEKAAFADATRNSEALEKEITTQLEQAEKWFARGAEEVAESPGDAARDLYQQSLALMEQARNALMQKEDAVTGLDALDHSRDVALVCESLQQIKEAMRTAVAEAEKMMNAALKAHRDAASAAEALEGIRAEAAVLSKSSRQAGGSIREHVGLMQQSMDSLPGDALNAADAPQDFIQRLDGLDERMAALAEATTVGDDVDAARASLEQMRAVLHEFNTLVEEAGSMAKVTAQRVVDYQARLEEERQEQLSALKKEGRGVLKATQGIQKKAAGRKDKSLADAEEWEDEAVEAKRQHLLSAFEALQACVDTSVSTAEQLDKTENNEEAVACVEALRDLSATLQTLEAEFTNAVTELGQGVAAAKAEKRKAEKAEAAALKQSMKALTSLGSGARKSLPPLQDALNSLDDALKDDAMPEDIASALREASEAQFDALKQQEQAIQQAVQEAKTAETADSAKLLNEEVAQQVADLEAAAAAFQEHVQSAQSEARATLERVKVDALKDEANGMVQQANERADSLAERVQSICASVDGQSEPSVTEALETVNAALADLIDSQQSMESFRSKLNDVDGLEAAQVGLDELQGAVAALEEQAQGVVEKRLGALAEAVASAQEKEAAAMEAQAREAAMRDAAATRVDALIETHQQRLADSMGRVSEGIAAAKVSAVSGFETRIEALDNDFQDLTKRLADAVKQREQVVGADGDAARKAAMDDIVAAFESCGAQVEALGADVAALIEEQDKQVEAEKAQNAEMRREQLKTELDAAKTRVKDAKEAFDAARAELGAADDVSEALSLEAQQMMDALDALAKDDGLDAKEDAVNRSIAAVDDFKTATEQRIAEIQDEVESRRLAAEQAALDWQQQLDAVREEWTRVRDDVSEALQSFENTYSDDERASVSDEKWVSRADSAGEKVLELAEQSEEHASALAGLKGEAAEFERAFVQWLDGQKSAIEEQRQQQADAAERAKSLRKEIQKDAGELAVLHSHGKKDVSDLREMVSTHGLNSAAITSALDAADGALVNIAEASELGVDALESADSEHVEELQAQRNELAKVLKRALKAKAVLQAAVEAGREAAEAERAANDAANEKEQQRMTSAFTAGGLLLERLEEAFGEFNPWDERLSVVDWTGADSEMQELKSGFDQHKSSAERGRAMGLKAFEDAQVADASEDAAEQMAVLREAVDIVEEANEFAEEAYKALIVHIERMASASEKNEEEWTDTGATEVVSEDLKEHEAVPEGPAETPDVPEEIPADETPRGRLARLRRSRRGEGGARRTRRAAEDGAERGAVSRSERLERLRRARRTERDGEDSESRRPRRARGGERPRRRARGVDGEEATPRLRRRRQTGAEDGTASRPRRRAGASERLSRLRSGSEGEPRRRRRPSVDEGGERTVRPRRVRRGADGEAGVRPRARRRPATDNTGDSPSRARRPRGRRRGEESSSTEDEG